MLTGDAVDNVPGVPKVGPKTAAKWLNEFGSVDALVRNAESIKGVAGQNLRGAIANFELTRELLTVHTHCDIPEITHVLPALPPKPIDLEEPFALFYPK